MNQIQSPIGRLEMLAQLAQYYSIRESDSATYFCDQGFALAKEQEDVYQIARFHFIYGRIVHIQKRDYDKAIWHSKTSFSQLNDVKDASLATKLKVANAISIGDAFKRKAMADSAFYYYNMAQILMEENGDREEVWQIYRSKAVLFSDINEVSEAVKYGEKAYKEGKLYGMSRSQEGYLLFILANAALRDNDIEAYAQNVARLTTFYKIAEDPLDLEKKIPIHSSIKVLITDEDIFPTLLKALEESLDKKDYLLSGVNSENLAWAYEDAEKLDSAIKYRSIGAEYYRKAGLPNVEYKTIMKLCALYKKKGETRLAYQALEEAMKLRDSIQKEITLSKIAEMEVAFQTERKTKELEQKTTQRNIWILSSCALGIAAIVIFFLLKARLKLARRLADHQKREALQQVELARYDAMIDGQEEERKRVAQALHDSVGAMLASARSYMEAFLVKKEKTDLLAQSKHMLDKTSQEVRRISHNLMPLSLEQLGLEAALSDLASQLRDQGLACTYEFLGDEQEVTVKQKVLIYRMIQESVNNIRKHAKASHVLVQVMIADGSLDIMIEDDGVGIDSELQIPSDSLGIQGLHARANQLGGVLDISSKPNEGTCVSMHAPLTPEKNKQAL